MAKALSERLLQEYWAEHLPYEWTMFCSAYAYLMLDHGCVINNALIESFCIHARNLIDFYRNKQDVHAEHFTATGKYKCKYVGANQPNVGNSLYDKLNKQIAHMTRDRTVIADQKIGPADREKLLTALNKEREHFSTQLASKFGAALAGDAEVFSFKTSAAEDSALKVKVGGPIGASSSPTLSEKL